MRGSSFAIGERVIATETSPPIPLLVVSLPAMTPFNWVMYRGHPGGFPESPSDGPLVVVVDAVDIDRYLPEWDGTTPLTRSALDASGIYYRALTAAQLTAIETDTAPESAPSKPVAGTDPA